MEAVLARLPRQVVGVERYAVAAETGAGVEGREAVGLRLGGVYYLPHVDAHAVAEHAELVDEADVDVSVGVLEDLLHLGHGRARHARHAPLEHRLVDRADELERLLADGAHHLGRVLGLVDEVARIHALGREAQVEALAALEARPLLQDGQDQLLGGAGVGGGLEHHHAALADVGRYLAGGRLHVGGVGHLVGVERGGHADGDEAALRDAREVAGRLERAGLHERGEVLLHDVADVVLATVDHVDLVGLHVEANRLEARLGLLHGQRQPDVAEADRAADEGARQDAHPSLLKTHHNVFSLLLERVHNIPAT